MQGKIISNISNLYEVEVGKDRYQCTARGKFKNDYITPVVGDNVDITILKDRKGVMEDILPRKNYSKRPKLANLTQMILVLSSKNPKPDLLMLDKQLAYAEYLGLKVIIIINKIDLDKDQIANKIKINYEKIGYPVICTNAKEKIGIGDLKQLLKGQISAFSGNSGVGKSTLINQIFQKVLTEEGIISKKNKKGKNTTTSIQLYKIEEGYIADTPGFSTFDISEIPTSELANYFSEFKSYIKECEYTSCLHNKEENWWK